MTTFEQLTQAVEDYNTVWAAFRSSEQAAKDVTAAIGERIREDRQQLAERRNTLEAQSRDQNRPEVVRRLAKLELDRLQGRTITPTEDEAAAFAVAMEGAKTALRDAAEVKVKLRGLFEAATMTLAEARLKTLGRDGLDTDLAQRHLDGEQRAFDWLSREDGGSGE